MIFPSNSKSQTGWAINGFFVLGLHKNIEFVLGLFKRGVMNDNEKLKLKWEIEYCISVLFGFYK